MITKPITNFMGAGNRGRLPHNVAIQAKIWSPDGKVLAVAPADARHVISDESDDLAWFDVDALPAETDDSVRELIAAARTRLRGTP